MNLKGESKMKMLGAVVLAAILCASTARAEFYSWTDKEGKSHIAGKIEDVPQEYRAKVKVRQSLYKDDAGQSPASVRVGDDDSNGDGKLYYWKDASGRTHIADSIEQVPVPYRGSVEIRRPFSPQKKDGAPAPPMVKGPGQPEGPGIYSWTDKDGNVHITDSLEKVPQRYRSKVKVRKATEPERSDEAAPLKVYEKPQSEIEFYGDHPLDWWKEVFRKLQNDIGSLESGIAAKRQFVELFEKGARMGQRYESKDIDSYEQYKKGLPADEARLDSLRVDLDELRRKARIAGVPKSLRGE